jgi:hypothetical protein
MSHPRKFGDVVGHPIRSKVEPGRATVHNQHVADVLRGPDQSTDALD